MTIRRFSHLLLILALAAVTALSPSSRVAFAQSAPPQAAGQSAAPITDLDARLAAVEKTVEEKRREYHIPGAALVIVKDDRVIYIKGLGVKDFERGAPVTPDTLFPIGSSTKAFTGMAAVMSADDGKLSLDDSPKRFLPYFKLRDPEADARITLRDLLSHRSGLDRTDLSMVSGVFNREELIRVAGMAKPTAKLGEKFLYQNVMFAAAGEVVAKAQGKTWDDLIAERIFKPLGMSSSNTTVAATLKSKDYALGYTYNTATGETRHVPMREIAPAAPAGAINSSARDMAAWLRLMLGGGVFDGRRLVSEKGFRELVSPQNKVTNKINYGLGWFLRDWNGHAVVEHGGNIDGFNAQVAFMPDQKLGLVILTNISASPLGPVAMEAVWSNIVGKPQASAPEAARAPAGDISREVGKYLFAEANFNIIVEAKEGKLWLVAPGQPSYELANVGGRRYKLTGAPDGFFVTFRPAKGNEAETEVYLEQPHGNYVLQRIKEGNESKDGPSSAVYDGPLKEIIGSYRMKAGGGPQIEVTVREGKVALVVPGQPPYPLQEREKDKLFSPSLPDSYGVMVKRDAKGQVSGLVLKQPEGEFELEREAAAPGPALMTVDELMAKVIAAQGGEQNLRKHTSRVTTLDLVLEHQGLTGTSVITARAPNLIATDTKLWALGKQVATINEYFDGTRGVEMASFAPVEVKAGKALEDTRIQADFYGVLNWKQLFKTVVIRKMDKVGDEEVYVVVKTPEKGNPVTDYISAKSFLLLRRDTLSSSSTSDITLPVTETFSDYRPSEGLMVPFKTVTQIPTIGEIVSTVKSIKFDVAVPDTAFREKK